MIYTNKQGRGRGIRGGESGGVTIEREERGSGRCAVDNAVGSLFAIII